MRTFSRANQFKKDVKRAARRGLDLSRLKQALDALIEGHPLAPEYRDHPLHGNWSGSRDCHIGPDWVLIYTLENNHVRFERTGTHSDLFR
ncbi:MAG: type II toxin-antitoxin system YafQ family toxin [Deltaproteobacteria bacterium]|nr:type II toxin-antitoxin system YafQ family toxin [Deltaproteobacteria bacterium]